MDIDHSTKHLDLIEYNGYLILSYVLNGIVYIMRSHDGGALWSKPLANGGSFCNTKFNIGVNGLYQFCLGSDGNIWQRRTLDGITWTSWMQAVTTEQVI